MSYVLAKALRSFEHNGEIKTAKSKPFPVLRHQFNPLKAVGLVEEVAQELPKPPVGEQSSASPQAPALPAKTATASGGGEKKKQPSPRKASSSRTQPSA